MVAVDLGIGCHIKSEPLPMPMILSSLNTSIMCLDMQEPEKVPSASLILFAILAKEKNLGYICDMS